MRSLGYDARQHPGLRHRVVDSALLAACELSGSSGPIWAIKRYAAEPDFAVKKNLIEAIDFDIFVVSFTNLLSIYEQR